jgi:hypothetical protein
MHWYHKGLCSPVVVGCKHGGCGRGFESRFMRLYICFAALASRAGPGWQVWWGHLVRSGRGHVGSLVGSSCQVGLGPCWVG